ncbi:MAG TPA: leucyl aminopeptidase family protein [Gammaproteobacteria bacterium]|nr:leucyl aminopeptidase family protein [Gammaproteobacteria bacterium]
MSRAALDRLDQLIVALPQKPAARDLRRVPQGKQLKGLLAKKEAGEISSTRLTNTRATGIVASTYRPGSRFEQLTWARKVIAACQAEKPSRIGILAAGLGNGQRSALSALVSAALAAGFALPNRKSKAEKPWRPSSIKLYDVGEKLDLHRVGAQAIGNNLARWLTALPPNVLTAGAYRDALRSLAREHRIKFEFIDERRLERLGAGAFLAVSQGNADRDAGIAHLHYEPRNAKRGALALVGKGILFDTGGTNLKPFKSMLDMHTDMQGSAVALGCLIALATLKAPFPIDLWLAISENRISATAYKPQDIITAANGTTIQVIHTDAEGRLVLADTLALASREQPALMIDFATLTGACVGALTERYSGVFSNRPAANAVMRLAGSASGERVWPFPMDADYDELLRSETADVKQCSPTGSGDHILAARFLSRFVPSSVPWIHIDLSAGQHKDGLAQIPSEITGFGVGLTLELLASRLPAALAKELT